MVLKRDLNGRPRDAKSHYPRLPRLANNNDNNMPKLRYLVHLVSVAVSTQSNTMFLHVNRCFEMLYYILQVYTTYN